MLVFMTNDDQLAAFYRRCNACCNEHRFEDLGEFVADDVVINGTDHGLSMYADNLRPVVQAFPDFRWTVRHLMIDVPRIAAHFADTGTHCGPFLGYEAQTKKHGNGLAYVEGPCPRRADAQVSESRITPRVVRARRCQRRRYEACFTGRNGASHVQAHG